MNRWRPGYRKPGHRKPGERKPGHRKPGYLKPGHPTLPGDAGSITPLVLGMMFCLLLLAAGVIAAGSAFLGGQKVQRLCDGASTAAANSAPALVAKSDQSSTSTALQAAQEYLAIRNGGVRIAIRLDQGVVFAHCTAQVPITFGAVFGSPTLERAVDSVGQPDYQLG